MIKKTMLAPAEIRKTLVENQNLHKPMVLRNLIDLWPAANWTPKSLSTELAHEKLRFRIGKRTIQAVQWETGCEYKEASIENFTDWVEGTCNHDNPLAAYPRDTHWCYADYMYMAKVFADKPHMLEAVQWSTFGFEGRNGKDSTWWLGSEEAHTVCHYDTYGCNLVAQLYGRKHWVMFPPQDTSNLYPTRLPYEESSVFSKVNIPQPDLKLHPNFKNVTRYDVVLEPGDVLFVPRQWWHHVASLETSISVNTWIELECDHESRLQEAITRLLACSLLKDSTSARDGDGEGMSRKSAPGGSSHIEGPPPDVEGPPQVSTSVPEKPTTWLNPTEELTPYAQNIWYVQQIGRTLQTSNAGGGNNKEEWSKSHQTADSTQKIPSVLPASHKRINLEDTRELTPEVGSQYPIFSEDFDKEHVCVLQPVKKEFQENASDSGTGKPLSDLSEYDIIDAILQPDIVQLVCEKLRSKRV